MTRRRKPAPETLRQRAEESAAERYRATLAEVAADLGFDANSDAAEHVAVLRLMRKAILGRLLRSDVMRTDPDDLLKLDEALKQYMPASKAPQLQVTFVEGVTGIYKCKCCGEMNELEPGSYTPEERPKRTSEPVPPIAGPSTTDQSASTDTKRSSSSFEPTPAPAPPPVNVVPFESFMGGVSRAPVGGDTYNPFGSEYHRG